MMNNKELIGRMTLEEKASLLSGKDNFSTKSVERLGIPSIQCADGPHGLRKQTGAADHLGLNASLPATCFPTAAAMANSWDTQLGEALGMMLGEEAAAQGVSVLLGPGLNMKRSPLCGRNFEYFSEDPYLAGKMAAAYIRGIQSKGVSACPKHFAVNNQETLRMHSDSVVDERTLREIYLTGFEIAVKEGKPKSLMTAYNRVNGSYANENPHLMQDILVDEWGFDGLIVTDWGGSNDRVDGLICGNHLEMPATNGDSDREIVTAVKEGRLSETLLDQRVEEYLNLLFDTVIPKDTMDFDVEVHHQFAQEAARSSIVLLKNQEEILPLKAGTKTAILGDFAEKPRYQGAGSSVVNPTKLDSAVACFDQSDLVILGYEPGYLRSGGEDEERKESAVRLASQAEIVLLYLGLDEVSESEGSDRRHMRLNQNQEKLLEAVYQVNQNIIAVLSGGAPFEMPWESMCKGILHGYLGGQAGAKAMTEVISGHVNPSGKLNETWVSRSSDVPVYKYFPGLEETAEYREGPFIGYRYYQKAGVPVLYPFGYGLSYTSFAYADLEVSEHQVSFAITNTGSRGGAEAAQLYIGKKDSALYGPVRELKGFTKVYLQPGERKSVTIDLDDKAFRYFNITTEQFETEGGTYEIFVGTSSEEIRLTGTILVNGTGAPNPYDASKLPSYFSGKITCVEDKEFQLLLGRNIPKTEWDRGKPLGRNDTISQLCYSKSWLGRLVYRFLAAKKKQSEEKGIPDLNILFIYNMPFRGIAKMMGGAVDLAMVDAVLEMVNGHFFRGTGHLLSAFFNKNKAAKDTMKQLQEAGKKQEGIHES